MNLHWASLAGFAVHSSPPDELQPHEDFLGDWLDLTAEPGVRDAGYVSFQACHASNWRDTIMNSAVAWIFLGKVSPGMAQEVRQELAHVQSIARHAAAGRKAFHVASFVTGIDDDPLNDWDIGELALFASIEDYIMFMKHRHTQYGIARVKVLTDTHMATSLLLL